MAKRMNLSKWKLGTTIIPNSPCYNSLYKTYRAHVRKIWVATNGDIPFEPGSKRRMSICHRCDNPKCVNLSHLVCWTNRQNHDDMVNKGRSTKGHPTSNHSPEVNKKRSKSMLKAWKRCKSLRDGVEKRIGKHHTPDHIKKFRATILKVWAGKPKEFFVNKSKKAYKTRRNNFKH